MEKIEIKTWKYGSVIFSYTCENNTIKKTVEKAVKQGVSLAHADLSGADLNYACLYGVDLYDANLSNANLKHADLTNAKLSFSNLTHSYFNYAKLCGALLDEAYLYLTNFMNANMIGTTLRRANLCMTNLKHANLTNANLIYSTFYNVDLSTAILDNVKGLNDQCPKTGSFIGWKKCVSKFAYYIVKLEIPADAKRGSATTNKCRCNKAKVLEIQNIDGTESDINEVYSGYDHNFKYKIGKMVEVPDFDEQYWYECAPGIHFFMNREDAVSYW